MLVIFLGRYVNFKVSSRVLHRFNSGDIDLLIPLLSFKHKRILSLFIVIFSIMLNKHWTSARDHPIIIHITLIRVNLYHLYNITFTQMAHPSHPPLFEAAVVAHS